MAKKIICPGCLSDMVSESAGWRCKNCRGFISLQDGKFYEYVEKPFMPPMTNADRIRAMSDDELANWMAECNAYGERAEASQWLPWLQQPAED